MLLLKYKIQPNKLEDLVGLIKQLINWAAASPPGNRGATPQGFHEVRGKERLQTTGNTI